MFVSRLVREASKGLDHGSMISNWQVGRWAGEKIVELRAIPIKDWAALLAQTAPHANIRVTGCGRCIATERGCGGAGLYEAARCPGRKNSVINEFFAGTRQDIYIQQQELIKIEDTCPAVRQRAERDLQVALDVLTSMGLSPTNDDMDGGCKW